MQKFRSLISRRSIGEARNSLDTSSSMNTAETDNTCHTGGECSSVEFPDCPFLGNRTYAPCSELFKHTMGLIYLARCRDNNTKVVIKLIERGSSMTNHVAAELALHRKCAGHPFMTQLLDLFLTPTHLAIVIEHIPDGDISQLIESRGALPENEARWLFQQILVAIMYLHSIGAAGREIKLDNMYLHYHHLGQPSCDIPTTTTTTTTATNDTTTNDNGVVSNSHTPPIEMAWSSELESYTHDKPTVKMLDFTYSKSEQINSDPASVLSSLPYTAPEVLNNTMKEGTSADVWALGVALYKLVTGMYPFEREDDMHDTRSAVHAVLTRIAKVDYVIPDTLSPGLKDVLGRMLVSDPKERIKMEDLVNHPWVKENMPPDMMDINVLMKKKDGHRCPVTQDMLCDCIEQAKSSLRPLNSDNIDEMADDILNEEEADDLLDELSLR